MDPNVWRHQVQHLRHNVNRFTLDISALKAHLASLDMPVSFILSLSFLRLPTTWPSLESTGHVSMSNSVSETDHHFWFDLINPILYLWSDGSIALRQIFWLSNFLFLNSQWKRISLCYTVQQKVNVWKPTSGWTWSCPFVSALRVLFKTIKNSKLCMQDEEGLERELAIKQELNSIRQLVERYDARSKHMLHLERLYLVGDLVNNRAGMGVSQVN